MGPSPKKEPLTSWPFLWLSSCYLGRPHEPGLGHSTAGFQQEGEAEEGEEQWAWDS